MGAFAVGTFPKKPNRNSLLQDDSRIIKENKLPLPEPYENLLNLDLQPKQDLFDYRRKPSIGDDRDVWADRPDTLRLGLGILAILKMQEPSDGPDITDARNHLNNNRQAYLAIALAEAFADGVEINLDPSVIVTSVRIKPEPALPQA
ncbi:MAG: hypothetical protein V4702_04365 [Patescibacteria group bacterium]